MHPNTVRLYESWGFLGAVPRGVNGYRLFEKVHLQRMQLACIVMRAPWVGRDIRRSGIRALRLAAAQDLPAACAEAENHLSLVRIERARAQAAVEALQRWLSNRTNTVVNFDGVSIKQAAGQVGVSVDVLRNWERSGLLPVPRDPQNGYRRYFPQDVDRARVIRMLLRSGFSQMAVLRVLGRLDQANEVNAYTALELPAAEDVFSAADRWLSSLAEQEQRALRMIELIQAMG